MEIACVDRKEAGPGDLRLTSIPSVPRFSPMARSLPSVNTATRHPPRMLHLRSHTQSFRFDRHDRHGPYGSASRDKCKSQTRLQHSLRLAHSRSNHLFLIYRWFSRVSVLFTVLHPVG
ncbi:hypothetical protein AUEXF2481DRAFT_576121 [Aureobasidium subglaciale EXF-2481]|uniref:Uncharacterized protein n=1 Tax=Aureobasidium subglaciale (strain EXF-2481) TaxID=1043005 RepID=A0A074XXW7_AURSE|nr:uncharacterized protein AUEXF2481DRAFT_576121 [Aureobasidium subglaciale EXF-2481]KEQ90320.1 hypothetical protein AUEXF2481DRAFT_576121 [Aureobasidium subglaciale EXF-2481]